MEFEVIIKAQSHLQDHMNGGKQMRSLCDQLIARLCEISFAPKQSQRVLIPRIFRRRKTEIIIGRNDIPCGRARSDLPIRI